jgi:vacuolar-type H+-ATPase subunit C/Vma6
VSRVQKYANVSVKIGCLRAELLSRVKMEELCSVKSIVDLVRELKETGYGEELARVSLPYTAVKLERAFQQNLFEVLFKVIKNSPKTTSGFLRNFVVWFEYENVKNVLSAVSAGSGVEELVSRIYFSVEDFLGYRGLMEKALAAEDVVAAVGILKNVANKPPLALGVKLFEDTGSTRFFEFLLDKSYYENLANDFENLPRRERESAVFYVATEVDGFILTTVLRGKLLDYDLQTLKVILPQHRFLLSKDVVEALLESGGFEEAMRIVLSTPYGRFVDDVAGGEERVMSLEKSLEVSVLDYAYRRRIVEMFTVGAVLRFIHRKRVEVHNLVKLSLGVEYGFEPEKILDLLIFPMG